MSRKKRRENLHDGKMRTILVENTRIADRQIIEVTMFDNRFSDTEIAMAERLPSQFSAFHLVPVGPQANSQPSSLQWLYQQMYVQAIQANQKPASRDLFAVMN